MRKYWAIGKNVVQEFFEYRLNLGLEVMGGVLFTLVTIWLWQTIIASREGPIGSFDANQLITYLLGAGIITSYYFLSAQGDDINDEINQGDLSLLLVRPIRPLWYWFIRDQIRKFVTITIGASAFILIGLAYAGFILPPVSISAASWFLIFVYLGGVVHFFLFTALALLAFWSRQTWGERFFVRVVSELASGVLIPLTLLPALFQSLVSYLPFRFFAFVPMEIYLGHLTETAVWREAALLAAWLVGLLVICLTILRAGLRQYAGEGA